MQLSRFLAKFGMFVLAFGLSRSSWATNICDETVASNRIIDGFPAYSQCTAASSSSIYSNNGIDTATASGGTGWVRTQMGGGYQCTEWAHRYLYFTGNHPGQRSAGWDTLLVVGLAAALIPLRRRRSRWAPADMQTRRDPV